MSVKPPSLKLPLDVKIDPDLLTGLQQDVIVEVIRLHRLCSKTKDPHNKIRNPKTNVCVKLDGKIG